MDPERFELENPEAPVEIARDPRPHMPEPLPVKLVAVADVTLPMTTGLEHEMDEFYVGMWGFEKEQAGDPSSHRGPAYRAENFFLRFEQQEGLVQRDGYRPVQIEILSLVEAERKLIDAEVEYERQRGLMPGMESLALLDPAGNAVELLESRGIR